ncbi:MAG: hypothetical protein OXC61_10315 [Flavobacteriaceae bacterium]|nr:hypothetical protein [Flavobacteriaceae bacterium]
MKTNFEVIQTDGASTIADEVILIIVMASICRLPYSINFAIWHMDGHWPVWTNH